MTKKQLEVFDGIMISDGYLNPPKTNSSFRMCVKHLEFVERVRELVPLNWAPIRPSSYFDKRTNKRYFTHVLQSRRSTFLTEQRNRWYPNGKKIVPKDFKVTATSLLWWYIGDGCLLRKKTRPKYRRVQLATDCFSDKDVNSLIYSLKIFLKDKNIYREEKGIIISRTAVCKFAKKVGTTSPVKKYQYKFDFGQYLDKDYAKKSYGIRPSVLNFGDRMRESNSKKVMCLESGFVFYSATEAANSVGCCISSICDAVKSGRLCFGKHWKYIKQEREVS